MSKCSLIESLSGSLPTRFQSRRGRSGEDRSANGALEESHTGLVSGETLSPGGMDESLPELSSSAEEVSGSEGEASPRLVGEERREGDSPPFRDVGSSSHREREEKRECCLVR